MNALAAALAAHAAGLCVLPPREDGSKRPIGDSWQRWQQQRPDEKTIRTWYSSGRSGVGVVTGRVSGTLELFEFDDAPTQAEYLEAAGKVGLGPLVERIAAGYSEATPGGGLHLLYRCPQIGPSTKLASRPGPPDSEGRPTEEVLIESRGEGGYCVTAPSNGRVHPSGKPYRLLSGGFGSIATITPAERRSLHDLARTFDKSRRGPIVQPTGQAAAASVDFGGFNARATWAEVLEPHGWAAVFEREGVAYWRRPGKTGGVSATTGFDGSDLLYVFSTSTLLAAGQWHSKFAAFATLAHGGDFEAARAALRAQGYADPAPDNGQQAVSHSVTPLNSSDSVTDRSAAIVQVWQQPEPAPRRWVLPGLLPEGCLSIFYGDAGVFKSWLATALAVSLAAGRPFLGYDLSASTVLYLDSELDAEEFTRRAYQVARGLGLQRPPVGLHYLRLPGTLANLGVASTVAESVQSIGPRLTILDSLSLAAFGSDLSGAEGATLVLHLVKQWGTVLALDHCPKPMPGVEMSSYRPYGSQFKYAEGRSIVQVLRAESGRGALLRPVKSNFGPLGEPVGASVTFLPDRVEVARADLGSLAMAGAEKHLPARDRLLLALDAAGESGATPDELAEETDLAKGSVKNALTSLLAMGRVERLGDGRWRRQQAVSHRVITVKGCDSVTGRPPAIEAPDPETPCRICGFPDAYRYDAEGRAYCVEHAPAGGAA